MKTAKDLYDSLNEISSKKEIKWDDLPLQDKLRWHAFAIVFLSKLLTPDSSMTKAAVDVMRRPRSVDDTKIEDHLAKQFKAFYSEAIKARILEDEDHAKTLSGEVGTNNPESD